MMTPADRLYDAWDKMPKEDKLKLLPTLKELNRLLSLRNEGIQRKNAFMAQFTTVVGVVFSVLAAFNVIGQNVWADIFYLAGIFCCGICLVLCVICLCKPIYDNNNQQEDAIERACEELDKAYLLETTTEEQPKGEKKRFPFQEMRIAAYILFGVSIICILVKICILFYSVYYC